MEKRMTNTSYEYDVRLVVTCLYMKEGVVTEAVKRSCIFKGHTKA